MNLLLHAPPRDGGIFYSRFPVAVAERFEPQGRMERKGAARVFDRGNGRASGGRAIFTLSCRSESVLDVLAESVKVAIAESSRPIAGGAPARKQSRRRSFGMVTAFSFLI